MLNNIVPYSALYNIGLTDQTLFVRAGDSPQIKFHHPSSNKFVYINGQKFPSLPRDGKGRTCSFHKDLPEFITSQYTIFSYGHKEERCILCKNFKLNSDSRDVHVRCEDRKARLDNGIHGSKVLPLKIHTAVNYHSPARLGCTPAASRGAATPGGRVTRQSCYSRQHTNPSPFTSSSPTSRLSVSRNSRQAHQDSRQLASRADRMSPSEFLNATFPPFAKERPLPSSPVYRKYTTPIEHFKPIVRVDSLLSNMRSMLNPVYVNRDNAE